MGAPWYRRLARGAFTRRTLFRSTYHDLIQASSCAADPVPLPPATCYTYGVVAVAAVLRGRCDGRSMAIRWRMAIRRCCRGFRVDWPNNFVTELSGSPCLLLTFRMIRRPMGKTYASDDRLGSSTSNGMGVAQCG